jgi:Leucine-rich repeat (LRR) protein
VQKNEFLLIFLSNFSRIALVDLYFKSTAFAGDIPRLPSGIEEFDASFSLISGGLVAENFQGLNSLEYLVLSGNALNSTVPSVLATLPNLEFLYLSDAFISGDLSYMEGMESMIEHWIDLNPDFGGPIPAFVGNILSLASLSVTQTNMVGTLPSQLNQLFNMETMWFYGNSITGSIPSEYGDTLTKMKVFRVEENALTGAVPSSLCARRKNVFPFNGNLQVLGAAFALPVSHSNISCEKHLLSLF